METFDLVLRYWPIIAFLVTVLVMGIRWQWSAQNALELHSKAIQELLVHQESDRVYSTNLNARVAVLEARR